MFWKTNKKQKNTSTERGRRMNSFPDLRMMMSEKEFPKKRLDMNSCHSIKEGNPGLTSSIPPRDRQGELRMAMKKTKIFLQDHWHLLIKSAAQNHLRIQQCKKIKAGQACNLEFGSFTELKRYQKKVRLFTYSFSSTAFSVLIAIVAVQMFFGAGKSQGANYYWVQSAWSGVDGARVATSTNADHSNRTGWTEFSFKDTTVDVSGSDAKIATIAGSAVDTNATDFDTNTTKTNVYTVGTGDTYFALKKPDGATCTSNAECTNDWCDTGMCANHWLNAPTLAVGASGDGTGTISAATCQSLLNAIKVYKTDLTGIYVWRTAGNYWCNTYPSTTPPNSQCVLLAMSANNYLTNPQAYPNVDFSEYPAQNACKSIGGRLPSLAELACINSNKEVYGSFNTSILADYYWSSTEYNQYYTWMVSLKSINNGYQTKTTYMKASTNNNVRCVLGQ